MKKIKNLFVNYKRILSLSLALGFVFAHGIFEAKAENPNSISETAIYEIIDDEEVFDELLSDFGAYSQKDDTWGYTKYKETNISSGGCGPLSITNGLSLAFNVNSKDDAAMLLNDVIRLGSSYRTINNALLNGESDIITVRNKIDGEVFNGGENSSSIVSCVRNHFDNDTYIFGIMNFDSQSMGNVVNIIRCIYSVNPDTNIIFYNMTGGTLDLQRPFGSISNSGHYVTLLINAKEFVENNCVYLIDSLPKNLNGESNHRANYPFVEKPRYGRIREFNEKFSITRISEDIIKITGNEELNKDNMVLFGLEGGCGVIICPNNLTKTYRLETNIQQTKIR